MIFANTIAHDNTVLPVTMGAVATTEQAIINEAHRRDFVVPDRNREGRRYTQRQVLMLLPKKGLHEWIGSMDLNSYILVCLEH